MLQAGTLDFLAEAAGGEGCPHPTCFLLLSQHSPLPDSLTLGCYGEKGPGRRPCRGSGVKMGNKGPESHPQPCFHHFGTETGVNMSMDPV